MRIQKFDKGGYANAFTVYDAIEYPRELEPRDRRKKKDDDDDDEKGRLTEKDFFMLLKELDGLPNEMKEIVSSLKGIFSTHNLATASPAKLANMYISTLYKIKVAALNKARYDLVIKNAEERGSLSEPAIARNGNLVVLSVEDGGLTTVDLETYSQNKDKYVPVSVSQLADLRKFDPSLSHDQDTMHIIDNSMGFKEFQQMLNTAIQGLGSSSSTREGMFSAEGEASKGLQLLQSLSHNDQVLMLGSVTAEGLYKYKIIDKNQYDQINQALTYLVQALPLSAKTWAALKTGETNPDAASAHLIQSYLLGRSTNEHTVNVDYKGDMKAVKKGKSGSKDDSEGDMTFLTAVQHGYGGRQETRNLNLGDNTNFRVTGTAYGGFMGLDGKTLMNKSLADMLAETGIAGITNTGSILFGDNVINANALSRIAVLNNGGFWAALPIIRLGNTVVPDFDLMKAFSPLVKETIEELGQNSTLEERQALLERKIKEKPQLQSLLDASGKLDQSKFQAFFIVDGLASDLNFDFSESDEMIKRTDDQEDIQYFKEVTKNEDFDEDDNIFGDLFGMYDTLYKSKVFIPIQTNNRLAAMIFSGQKIDDDDAMKIETEYLKSLVRDKMNKPSSAYLNERE